MSLLRLENYELKLDFQNHWSSGVFLARMIFLLSGKIDSSSVPIVSYSFLKQFSFLKQ